MVEFAREVVVEFWGVLTAMSPYLLFGFFVAGVLSVFVSTEMVERHLGGKGLGPVLKATLFGIPLPLCSCGVIPVAASIKHQGATSGATTSFLLSTPQTGVDSILVTYSLLGPVFAVFRPLIAFVSGMVGGSVVTVFDEEKIGEEVEQLEHVTCEDECCEEKLSTDETEESRIKRILHYGFVALPKDIGKALLFGIVIAGFISVIIPDDYFAGVFGTGFMAMVVMMLLGLPVYVCATASVPIAVALISKGISPGAAFVFLTTGPATNAATIATVWRIMGKRVAVLYLLTVAFTAFGGGILLDAMKVRGSIPMVHEHEMIPGIWMAISAVVLLALLSQAFVKYPIRKGKSKMLMGSGADSKTLFIEGMTCTHCAENVEKNLSRIDGVKSVDVDVRKGTAVIVGDDLQDEKLKKTVESIGYEVTRISGAI